MLSDEQVYRYSRHILLPEVGEKGQRALLDSRVLIVGAGGLGAPAAIYLAAAGVGAIGILDGDVVDLTNLQRQVIHFTPDIGKPKVESAREKISSMNPDVDVRTYREWACAANIAPIIAGYDFIIDGTDNLAAKFLINDACVLGGKPFSHAGILQFHGQAMTVVPGNSACLRCLFPEPPSPDDVPTCSQAGVFGVLSGVVGSIQATEAVKFLLGKGEMLSGRLLTYDALTTSFREVPVARDPRCPICGEAPVITSLRDEAGAMATCVSASPASEPGRCLPEGPPGLRAPRRAGPGKG